MASPNSGFSFGASDSPVSNSTPQPGVQPMDAWSALAQMLAGTRQQTAMPTMDFGSLLQQVHQVRDPQGFANRSYVPGGSGPYNPFTNGFFKSADERKQIEQDRLGTPGFSSLTPEQQASALRSNQPQDRIEAAVGASPLPFQLSPETLAMIHQMPNPPTTAMNLFGFPSRELPPLGGLGYTPPVKTKNGMTQTPFGGVGPTNYLKPGPMGSPSRNSFSFGF